MNPIGPIDLDKPPFTDKNYSPIENVRKLDIWYSSSTYRATDSQLAVYDSVVKAIPERIQQFEKFLLRHKINIDTTENRFEEWDKFLYENIDYVKDESGTLRASDFWVSLTIDFALYLGQEKINRYPTELKWNRKRVSARLSVVSVHPHMPLAYIEEQKDQVVASKIRFDIFQAAKGLDLPIPYKNNIFRASPSQRGADRTFEEKLQPSWFYYNVDGELVSSKRIPRPRKAVWRDTGYNPSNFSELYTNKKLSINASLDLSKQLLEDKEERLQEFSSFLDRNNIRVDTKRHYYNELHSFILLNIDPHPDFELEYFRVDDYWMSLLIDAGLYLGEAQTQIWQDLYWEISKYSKHKSLPEHYRLPRIKLFNKRASKRIGPADVISGMVRYGNHIASVHGGLPWDISTVMSQLVYTRLN